MSNLAIPDSAMNTLPAPTGSLDAYMARISGIPVLSAEEERGLARRWRDEQDVSAAQQLVLSNLRFVVHIARGYRGYGLALADLVQEGNIGLMKAVKRFDPEMSVRLVSFAVHWIKAEIHEFILRNWRIVKVATTKAQRKLFFRLRGSRKRLGWFNDEEVNTVAKDLGVPASTVREMESRLSGHDYAFDMEQDDDGDNNWAPEQYLSASNADPAEQLENADWADFSKQQLHAALAELDERSREILLERWISEPRATLRELAERYSVSAERVRQIENQAVATLRKTLASAA